MDDGWVHPLAQSLKSTTCDGILLWMIQIWMKIHLVNESKLQHCKSINFPSNYKEWQIMLG